MNWQAKSSQAALAMLILMCVEMGLQMPAAGISGVGCTCMHQHGMSIGAYGPQHAKDFPPVLRLRGAGRAWIKKTIKQARKKERQRKKRNIENTNLRASVRQRRLLIPWNCFIESFLVCCRNAISL
jgi:hypothetical protein